MNKLILTAIWSFIFLSANGFARNEKTFFQMIAGNWEGTLEYQDYSQDKRVKLKTYLTVTPAPDGFSAEFQTVYEDFGRILKNRQIYKIDATAKTYVAGDYEYKIDSIAAGKIVLSGNGQDGEKIEPIRQTITFDADSLNLLKETRTPWQFRNEMRFRRSSENVLAKKTFSPAALKADLALLKNALTTLHPGIYRYQTPESLEKIFAATEAKLANPLSEAAFFRLVSQLANRLYCGHTYLNPYNQNALVRERLTGGKTYLPFYFRIVDGRFIVTENASSARLAAGSEITRINGVSARKIIETLLTVTRGDGKNTLAHRVQSLELPRFDAERYALFDWYFPLFFPLADETFTIEATDFATGEKRKLHIPAMTKEERTAEMAKRYGKTPTYDDGWKFEIRDNSLGYLKIDNSITWRLKTVKFKEFLAEAFARLRAQNVKNLVIDLRGNGGGSMEIGFELARYLAQKSLPPYAASRFLTRNVAAQPALLVNLDAYSDELKDGLKNGLAVNQFRRFDERYFEIVGRENYRAVAPYENNFRGAAYIISDASNASATFQFLNYARENDLAKIVGQTTGGNRQGINGGNYFFLSLPNSRIEIDIPVYFQAPPTAQKDEGVIPDVSVERQPEDIGNNFDREMETIKKLIGRTLQAK